MSPSIEWLMRDGKQICLFLFPLPIINAIDSVNECFGILPRLGRYIALQKLGLGLSSYQAEDTAGQWRTRSLILSPDSGNTPRDEARD